MAQTETKGKSFAQMGQNAGQRSAHWSTWIYNPWLDLIVGCGAWSAPLLLISYLSIASSTRSWSLVFYALALVFNYPHYMATIYRAYHRAEDFHKYRIFTVHITILLALTLILSHSWASILPWIFTIYLTWSPWHYSGQNYGLFMMFARRAGAQPDEATRRALYGAFVVSYLILFLGFHTGISTDPLFLSLGIPAAVSRWEQAVLAIAFAVLAIYGLRKLAVETGWRKLIPSLTLLSSQFLWFLLPAAISWIKGLDVPQSRYSTGVLAVMHSAQYLWITSYYAQREATVESGRRWRSWGYFGVLIAGGIALFVPGPWLASRLFHHDFTASFLIFTALVNIHNFMLDGANWKLRDGRIALLLLNTRERITHSSSQAGDRLSLAWRWLVGETDSAHRLRVGVAIVLLAFGAVDQLRHYLALHGENLQDLRSAAILNSYDSSLQMRLARNEMKQGQAQTAEAAWQEAIRVNPEDPAPRQDLLQFLIQRNRFDEALSLAEASLRYTPKDVSLLVDRGLLLQQSGKPGPAVESWNQALAIDPSHASAQLYLAYALDREGKPREAAAHYKSFLEIVAGQTAGLAVGAQQRPDPEKMIAIVLRMANCQARAHEAREAVRSYQLAANLAGETKQSKLESVADVNLAALEAESGNLDEALQLYQQVLKLDESSGDPKASAQDWLAYGQFLSETGFSARLAYACLMESEKLQETLPDSAQQQLRKTVMEQLTKRARFETDAVRHNLSLNLSDALSLRR
jgi:tetratricopeptide (TPR) repeat protein